MLKTSFYTFLKILKQGSQDASKTKKNNRNEHRLFENDERRINQRSCSFNGRMNFTLLKEENRDLK
jgi:hypothetical protein